MWLIRYAGRMTDRRLAHLFADFRPRFTHLQLLVLEVFVSRLTKRIALGSFDVAFVRNFDSQGSQVHEYTNPLPVVEKPPVISPSRSTPIWLWIPNTRGILDID